MFTVTSSFITTNDRGQEVVVVANRCAHHPTSHETRPVSLRVQTRYQGPQGTWTNTRGVNNSPTEADFRRHCYTPKTDVKNGVSISVNLRRGTRS